MVLIEANDGTKVEIKPNKDLYEEFSITKKEAQKLIDEGKKIKFYSFQRIVKTKNHKQQALIKELSLPDELSFWSEPLDRKMQQHKVWFKSDSLDVIFSNYAILLERLRAEEDE